MKSVHVLPAVFLFSLTAAQSLAQFVRPPVIVRPPIPVHVPVHVPVHPVHSGATDSTDVWPWVLGGAGALAVAGGGWFVVNKMRTRAKPRALIRITALPPGEAPEAVRRAWIGLELPLIVGQVQTENITAQQAVSHQTVHAPHGYAVEGPAAIAILAAASPDAADWWRQNAPHVLASGYQLIFPAIVCERLDDLASVGA